MKSASTGIVIILYDVVSYMMRFYSITIENLFAESILFVTIAELLL